MAMFRQRFQYEFLNSMFSTRLSILQIERRDQVEEEAIVNP
jgi:hypothetical protein